MNYLKIADLGTIQKRLNNAEKENKVTITRSQRKFYLQMMAYFIAKPFESKDEDGNLKCHLSVKQLAAFTGLPLRTTVLCIAALVKCGVIIRQGGSLQYGNITTTVFPKKYWHEQQGGS